MKCMENGILFGMLRGGEDAVFQPAWGKEFFRSENREAYRMNKVGTCFF